MKCQQKDIKKILFSKEEIKAMADFITLSNEESGVAYAVEKFI